MLACLCFYVKINYIVMVGGFMYYECIDCGHVGNDDFFDDEENICEHCGSCDIYFYDNE